VQDTVSKEETQIASIKVPGNWNWMNDQEISSFIEYGGEMPLNCQSPVGYSKATFGRAHIDNNTGKASVRAQVADPNRFQCATRFLRNINCNEGLSCEVQVGTAGS